MPRIAGQLHGVLGQAPRFFQVFLGVCPKPAWPAQVGTGSVVARASGTRRRNLRHRCRICKGAETLALRRRSHRYASGARYPPIHPLNIARKHDHISRPMISTHHLSPGISSRPHRASVISSALASASAVGRFASAVPVICFPRQGRASQRVAVDQHPALRARV